MLNISAERDGDHNVIKVNEESLDTYNAPELMRYLFRFFVISREDKKLGGDKNCLDLSDVERMDSSGYKALLVFANHNDNSCYGKPCLKGIHGAPKMILDMNYTNRSTFDFI